MKNVRTSHISKKLLKIIDVTQKNLEVRIFHNSKERKIKK